MGASSRWRLFMSDVSFKGTDAERTVAHRWGRWRRAGRCRRRGLRNRRLVFCHIVQKSRRGHEEQVSGNGAAEVKQPVVVAGGLANEHIFKHLLDGAERTAVTDKVSAKFTLRGPSEGHIVAQDLDLFPVLDDGRERVVR